jgi:hypothetical protein
MPLARPWQPLERSTIESVSDRYGIYEIVDEDGSIIAIEHGPLRDELKEALAYGGGKRVRWQSTQDRNEAERLVDTHRDRHDTR